MRLYPAFFKTVVRSGRAVQTEEPLRRRTAHDVFVTNDIVDESLQTKKTIFQKVSIEIVTEPALGRERQAEVRKEFAQLENEDMTS